MVGDEIRRAASWRGNPSLGSLAGGPVRLRFVMHDADLFSLRFRQGERLCAACAGGRPCSSYNNRASGESRHRLNQGRP
jgi:hypothetical protein